MYLVDNYEVLTASTISASDTFVTLSASNTQLSSNDYTLVTFLAERKTEYVWAKRENPTTLELLRGQDGTTAKTWEGGTKIISAVSAFMLKKLATNYTGVLTHLYGSVVITNTGEINLNNLGILVAVGDTLRLPDETLSNVTSVVDDDNIIVTGHTNDKQYAGMFELVLTNGHAITYWSSTANVWRL